MSKKGQLFSLIKSMSQSEKRHFKLFLSTAAGDKNYLKLFNFIDRQKELNDQEIKAHFKGDAFVKQLHVTKNYLKKQILKSLRHYHSKHSVDASLKERLREIEILFQKDLFDHCRELVDKALEKAEHYEKLQSLLALYGWKKKLLLNRHGPFEAREEVLSLIEKEKELIDQLANHNAYWALTMDSMDFDRVQETLKNPLLQGPEEAKSLQAKILYYHICYSQYVVTGAVEQALQSIDDLIGLLEEIPERIREDPAPYITALNNKTVLLLRDGKLDQVYSHINKIREAPDRYGIPKHSRLTTVSLLKTYNVELELYRDLGEYQNAVKLIDEVNEILEKHRETVPRDYEISFYYQFAYSLFKKGLYSRALKWINKIVLGNYGTIREDIQSYGRFLNLMIHLELEHIMILKYAVDGTRRFLKKKRDLHLFEKVLLRFFSQVSMALSRERKALFLSLNEELFKGEKEEEVKEVLDYLDFKAWIAEKLE